MLDNLTIKKVLIEALKTGADFAELYLEDTLDIITKMTKYDVKSIENAKLYGAGLRLLKGQDETYGYTNDLTLDGLINLANKLNKYCRVSVKYSCGFPDPQVFPIIVVDRYLDYFTTIMEDRLWEVLAKPVSRCRNRSGLSMNAARAA